MIATCAALAAGASPALAGVSVAVVPTIPANVTVGQTGLPTSLQIRNVSVDGPGESQFESDSYSVDDITLVASCGSPVASSDCPLGALDPGVVVPSPLVGTGAAGSACAGRAFAITQIDPLQGKYRFTPDLPFVLGPSEGTVAGARCIINFTSSVVRSPALDSNAVAPGLQTSQKAFTTVTDVTAGPNVGLTGSGIGTSQTTITRAATTIATNASPNIVLGAGMLTDTAVVSGRVNPQAGATITFSLYGPNNATCSGAPAFTATVAYPVAGGSVSSGAFTPTDAGRYRWVAAYSGDTNNAPVTGACNAANETTVVDPATPTITTNASANTAIGAGTLTDTAIVSGRVNPQTGATITFLLYGPGDATCSGPVAFTSTVAYPAAGGSVTSGAFTPTDAGTYRWVAAYSGDANNAPVTGACNDADETTVVARATPTIATSASPDITIGAGTLTDTAVVSGRVSPQAGATIAFRLYGPDDATCSGAPAFTSAVAYPVAGGSVTSGAFTPASTGSYRWVAAYSGDANNAPATGACNDANETANVMSPSEADLQVTITPDGNPVVPGENVGYTIVVRNNGPADAVASTLADTLPSYLTLVSIDDTTHCSASGQDIACAFGTLASGETRTIHVIARLDPDRTTPIANSVDVTTATTDSNPANNHDTATNDVDPRSDVSIHKTASTAAVNAGGDVTYTLVARNDGPSTARNVVVDDDIPAQMTFVSVSPGAPTCTQAAAHVHCDFGALAPGADRTVTITTRANGLPPDATSSHKLTVGKVEQYVSVQAGQTQTTDVTCNSNGYASDGSVEVMHVDQGTGSPADVQVLDAHSVAPGTYRFTVKNTTTGQAQAKLFVTCLPHDTDSGAHTHPLDVGPLQTASTGSLAPGRYTFTIPTSAGHRAIAPGIEVLSGNARLVGSEPAGNGWAFTVEVLDTATATLSIRALSEETGAGGTPPHTHALVFAHVETNPTLPPGESVQRVSCDTGYSGIVAGFDLPAGVISLGNEPQPINRDFRLLNTTGSNVTVGLSLECIRIETGSSAVMTSVVNTATVATTTTDPSPANNSDSATVVVSSAGA